MRPDHQLFFARVTARHEVEVLRGANVSAAMPGNREIADSLVRLYLSGKKTAGSGLVKDYETAGDPLPQVGNFWIVLDSDENPRCIAKTIRTEINPFSEVGEEIAIAEGEGDLSLGYWREGHRKFFQPFLADFGIDDLDSALVITEFYEVFFDSNDSIDKRQQ